MVVVTACTERSIKSRWIADEEWCFGALLRWINSYFKNRRAWPSLNKAYSRKFLLWHGVPQVGILSRHSSWFSSMTWCQTYPRELKLYCMPWCYGAKKNMLTQQHTTYRMQGAIDTFIAWVGDWCARINKKKSSTTLFKAGTINMAGTLLKEDEATYLGVTSCRHGSHILPI